MGEGDRIQLVHGDGGEATRELIEGFFLPRIGSEELRVAGDAVRPGEETDLWMTTDSFVVSPLQFPGGDIGGLAVNGTVNDLAVAGARPRWFSAGFILEEGLPLEVLGTVLDSMGRAARIAGVRVVAADTKVVERGAADGIYINTTGVGTTLRGIDLGPHRVRPGDAVVVTGPVGDHGVAIMAGRAGISFETEVTSDCAPLWPLTGRILEGLGGGVHFMRDPTRGGLATVLGELARAAGCRVTVEEARIPGRPGVRGAAEMLGLDPLYLACEGQAVIVVESARAERVLEIIRSGDGPWDPAIIGRVEEGPVGVSLTTELGGTRPLGPLRGDPLPRIC